MRWPVPAAVSSLIPPVLVRLGPLDLGQVAGLRPFLELVPDPRARRGRRYSLTAILLVCACAAVSGARSVDEIAEWAARASDTVLTAVGVRCGDVVLPRGPRSAVSWRPSTVTPWTGLSAPTSPAATLRERLRGNGR
ncbi:transposase family protein [Streptomyces adustus]|uniref:transposase family protein n=1 Tax=Streptomyces adustus TaxID=1609272 RepID=UPI001EE4A577|nr:transposase family protein [Streptomyces adustus]